MSKVITIVLLCLQESTSMCFTVPSINSFWHIIKPEIVSYVATYGYSSVKENKEKNNAAAFYYLSNLQRHVKFKTISLRNNCSPHVPNQTDINARRSKRLFIRAFLRKPIRNDEACWSGNPPHIDPPHIGLMLRNQKSRQPPKKKNSCWSLPRKPSFSLIKQSH